MAILKGTTESGALARELNDFLLELGLALQRYALYPGGHPSIDASVAVLVERVSGLLAERETLSLGVARRQLIVEGVATEDTHPVLRTVAERLHRHRVGVVSIHRGMEGAELSAALRAVSRDPERTGMALGLMRAEQHAEWPHVRFHALAYDHLQLRTAEEAEAEDGGGGSLAAQLWLGLARAALAKESLEGDAEPQIVARAINERHGVRAYDQVVVGYMLQLTEELTRDGAAGLDPVRYRMSQVVRRLDSGTLVRLLEMGGDIPQRARFLHGAARALQPDAVVEVMTAAAQAEGQSLSTSLMRLLRKLSTVALTPTSSSASADGQLREQVRDLLVGWSLADPNPHAYTKVLESVARGGSEFNSAPDTPTEPLRVVQMALELDTVGPAFFRALDALLAERRLSEVYALIEASAPGGAVVAAMWTRIENADVVRTLLTSDPIDLELLEPVLRRFPAATVISLLLDRLAESDSRATRMAVFRRLVAAGLPVAPAAAARLADPRWYVQRNMLALLHELGSWPAALSPLQFLAHQDARVRREAVHLAMRVDAERDAAMAAALRDEDERVVRTAMIAARSHGVGPVAAAAALDVIGDATLSSDVRTSLIRLLARRADREVIDRLLPLVVQGRTLLRGPRLMHPSPEMLAALSSLAAMDSSDPRVAHALELARRSSSLIVQRAAQRRRAPERGTRA